MGGWGVEGGRRRGKGEREGEGQRTEENRAKKQKSKEITE